MRMVFSSLGMSISSQPLHPVVVAAGQLHVAFRLRQGMVSQPLLEHRRRHSRQHSVPAVGVPQRVGVGPCAVSSPASMAASFIDLLTHCRLMSKRGFLRSFAWIDARSPRLSTRSAGMGTSRPFFDLFSVTSGRRKMIGGSWESRGPPRRGTGTPRPAVPPGALSSWPSASGSSVPRLPAPGPRRW